MTEQSPQQLFRQAALEEDGMPISAGARVAHVQLALASGRATMVDLSEVPADLRDSLIAQIRELVRLAASRPKTENQPPPDETTKTPS